MSLLFIKCLPRWSSWRIFIYQKTKDDPPLSQPCLLILQYLQFSDIHTSEWSSRGCQQLPFLCSKKLIGIGLSLRGCRRNEYPLFSMPAPHLALNFFKKLKLYSSFRIEFFAGTKKLSAWDYTFCNSFLVCLPNFSMFLCYFLSFTFKHKEMSSLLGISVVKRLYRIIITLGLPFPWGIAWNSPTVSLL